jgi:hypothetical protein
VLLLTATRHAQMCGNTDITTSGVLTLHKAHRLLSLYKNLDLCPFCTTSNCGCISHHGNDRFKCVPRALDRHVYTVFTLRYGSRLEKSMSVGRVIGCVTKYRRVPQTRISRNILNNHSICQTSKIMVTALQKSLCDFCQCSLSKF